MKSISKTIKTSALTLAVSTTLIGCGSSNSTTQENGETNNTGSQNVTNPFQEATAQEVLDHLGFSVKRQAPGSITEDNAESVILDSIEILDYLVREHSDYVNREGGQIDIDASLSTVVEQTLDCNGGGVQTGSINAPSQLVQDGYRVYGDGDTLSIDYQGCDYLGSPIWGSVGFEVDLGVWDITQAIASTTMLRHTFDDFFYTSNDGSTLLKYHNGMLGRTINDFEHKVQSEEFAIFDYQPAYDIEVVLSNLDVTVSEYSVNEFWTGDEIRTNDLLTVESNQVGMKYDILIMRAMQRSEVTSSAFTSGAMAIAAQIGTILVEFHDGYLEYELDAGTDGTFEIAGVIDASEY